ncbi:acid phosphatase AphA [Amphibiibacter pelophylacis]|uniref:Acid phosphatase AphA n=1 Tax=Amphibiibacter pelophylacis TaxID=1799477 RepID=A0ACC6P2M7_9BURK
MPQPITPRRWAATLSALGAALLLSACATAPGQVASATPAARFDARMLDYSKAPASVRWTTVDEIARSLQGQPPMNVGFDVDDTVLYSSPCFFYGQQKYSPGKNDYLGNQAFWDDINASCDQYSVPKDVARALINMHQARGDTIYFITARTPSPKEGLTATLQKDFGIKNMQPVIFTGDKPVGARYAKTPAIRQTKLSIYYGDANSDIQAAQEAGIRAIRVLRAPNSTYTPLPDNGQLGEEVIRDSAW